MSLPQGLFAIFIPGIQSVLDPAGPQAGRIYALWNVFLTLTTIVYIVVIAFVIAAVIRGRRRTIPDTSPESERPLTLAVSIGAGITVLTLIALLVASVATGSAVGNLGNDGRHHLEIQVTGHQWWWEVQYPDAEPDKMIRTADEIHIPVGRPVLFRLSTRDVIHSFWVPDLHGKRDLIPGRINKLWIQADRPGVYRAQCAEFCGLQHAHMAMTIVAQSEADFQRWKTHQQTPASDAVTPQQQHGRELFVSLPCSNCHAITGVNAWGTIGPDLTHIGSRPTIGAGTLINNRGSLGGWIVNAPAIKPGVQMPPNQISGADLQDLLAYLENLK